VMSPEGRRERFLLATFDRTQCAIPLTCIDRMVREPLVKPWLGRGGVRGFVMIEGWLVWVVAADEIFPDLNGLEGPTRGSGMSTWTSGKGSPGAQTPPTLGHPPTPSTADLAMAHSPDMLPADRSLAAAALEGSWLMLFRQEFGLTRLGVLASNVKGPLSHDRVSNLRILRPGPQEPREGLQH